MDGPYSVAGHLCILSIYSRGGYFIYSLYTLWADGHQMAICYAYGGHQMAIRWPSSGHLVPTTTRLSISSPYTLYISSIYSPYTL